MNIIRTTAMELTTIPAIAYKQKLASGGAGIKIIRLDQTASAMGTMDKRTGEVQPYGQVDKALFPDEAFDEALELVIGLPYSARGKIVFKGSTAAESEDVVAADEVEAEETGVPAVHSAEESQTMTDSPEYRAIVERYSDENGKMNYVLMNKDFIQFAAKSKVVATMIADKAHTDDIIIFVIKSRAALIAGKRDSLDDAQTAALIATLDEIDPRSAFKELKAHINRMQARRR